jgi:hypothetical protein
MAAKTGVASKIRKLKTQFPEMSQRAIAKRVGCNKSNVHSVLSFYMGKANEEELRGFQENKADIYDALQHRLLSSITPNKLAKAPAVSLITGAAILEDKARLVRGQATGINVNILMDVVEALRARPVAPTIDASLNHVDVTE